MDSRGPGGRRPFLGTGKYGVGVDGFGEVRSDGPLFRPCYQ